MNFRSERERHNGGPQVGRIESLFVATDPNGRESGSERAHSRRYAYVANVMLRPFPIPPMYDSWMRPIVYRLRQSPPMLVNGRDVGWPKLPDADANRPITQTGDSL
jgi:hypothetical protein